MKLFLDDIRDPPDQTWTVARSYWDAMSLVVDHGFPVAVSFDHDLGDDKTGYDFAKFLVELDLDTGSMPGNFSFNVHSANPPGAENIEALMGRYIRFRKQGH